jgi:hypothetical protein
MAFGAHLYEERKSREPYAPSFTSVREAVASMLGCMALRPPGQGGRKKCKQQDAGLPA